MDGNYGDWDIFKVNKTMIECQKDLAKFVHNYDKGESVYSDKKITRTRIEGNTGIVIIAFKNRHLSKQGKSS